MRLRARTAIVLVLVIAGIVTVNLLAAAYTGGLHFEARPGNEALVHGTLTSSALLFVALIAIPFVPAVEMGLLLLAAFGPAVALLLYVCTLSGLTLSFLVGRLIPLAAVARLFRALHLRRAGDLAERLAPMSRRERLDFLVERSPRRFLPVLVRHRYLALAVAFNVPGNVVIGGGGGIALTAGVSGLYSVPGFLLATALAVAPVPLAVALFGKGILA